MDARPARPPYHPGQRAPVLPGAGARLIVWPLLPPLLPDILVLLGRHQVPLPVRRGIHLAATRGLVRAAGLLPFAVCALTGALLPLLRRLPRAASATSAPIAAWQASAKSDTLD